MKGISNGFGVLGLIFLFMGIYVTLQALASNDWNQVEGTIINSKIRTHVNISNTTGQDHQKQYSINVVYDYKVEDIAYQQSRYSIGEGDSIKSGFKQKANAKQWLAQSDYKIGNKVTVFVNPSDNEDTVLSEGFNFSALIPIIMGLVLIGFAYLIRLVVKKETSKAEAITKANAH
jgi:hypothetical protein